ncbi:MAG: hypothetical protein WCA35_13040 [Kovacikia sp.]
MRLDCSAWLTQGFVVSCLIASSSVQAQIVPDGTLRGERSFSSTPLTERSLSHFVTQVNWGTWLS